MENCRHCKKEPKYYTTPAGEQKVNEESGWLKKTWTEKVLINKRKYAALKMIQFKSQIKKT